MRLSVCLQEPLSRHSALRTGGVCDAWVVVHDLEALVTVVSECRKSNWKLTVVGATTRTAVRDGPMSGAVVRLGIEFCKIEEGQQTWTVGAGVPVPALMVRAARAGRGGLEAFSGVSGTVAASLLLDDGWTDVVETVGILRRGRVAHVDLADVVGRRNVVVVEVRLSLPEVRSSLPSVSETVALPPGSWYSSTRGEPVRDVFRSVRLHMVRLREVAIPDAAPEMLVNLGGGTAADMALLSRSAFDRVKKVRGDQIEMAIRWLGSNVSP